MTAEDRKNVSSLLKHFFDEAYQVTNGLIQIAIDESEARLAEQRQAANITQAKSTPEPESLITIEEAARLLRMKRSTLYLWVAQNKYDIPCHKAGSSVRFDRGELLAWSKAQAQKAKQERQEKCANDRRKLRAVG